MLKISALMGSCLDLVICSVWAPFSWRIVVHQVLFKAAYQDIKVMWEMETPKRGVVDDPLPDARDSQSSRNSFLIE